MFFYEFYEIFKNTFFTEHLWTTASVIQIVECGILAIKKAVKTLQIVLYSVVLSDPIKHVIEKKKEKFDCKKKNILLSQLLFNCNIEKQR